MHKEDDCCQHEDLQDFFVVHSLVGCTDCALLISGIYRVLCDIPMWGRSEMERIS